MDEVDSAKPASGEKETHINAMSDAKSPSREPNGAQSGVHRKSNLTKTGKAVKLEIVRP